MATPAEVARAHQAQVIDHNETATRRALSAWTQVNPANLDASWAQVAPLIVAQAVNAQRANVASSSTYAGAAASAYELRAGGVRVVPESLAGVDGSGRSVESLLHGAVTTTKQGIGRGLPMADAMLTGATYLASMMKTALADVGRAADLTAATGKGWTRYVRVVGGGACSRCAILAGIGSYKVAFKRHPGCQCTAMPVDDDGAKSIPDNLFASPEEYFESLSPADQSRVFTKAGAEAIRAGANPISIVSARRGANGIGYSRAIGLGKSSGFNRMTRTTIGFHPDGSPIQVFTTTEGTTVRGAFGSQQRDIGVGVQRLSGSRYSSTKRIRIMPESIVELTDDLATRQLLLRDAGFLDYPIQNYSSNSWVAEHRRLRVEDRLAADRFYATKGIRLG